MTIIDRALLEPVMAPVEAARGLPNVFYTDAGVFDLEKAKVFRAGWACIGFGKDAPLPGDVWPLQFLGQPLVIARDRQGALRVFENVCRHRGMILIDKPGNHKAVIRCPYHSWCYGLDGALRTTPHVGGPGHNTHPGIKRDELGLIPVRFALWMDMVFINQSGAAPPFADYIAPIAHRWAEFAGRPLHHGGALSSLVLDIRCNWKLAVENYCEAYHLPWVHPGLNSYSRLEDHYNIVEPGAFSGQGSLVYTPGIGAQGERFADFVGLSQQWQTGAEYASLFPNVLLGVHKDHTFAVLIEPLAHDRTRERLEIYYSSPEMAGAGHAELRQRHMALWKEVFVEDIGVVEGMQRGRSAPGFDGGKFSPVMDPPTHCFHDWVARRFAPA